MTEALSLLQLLVGLTAICGAAACIVSCLRLRSPVDFVLGTYVVAWTLAVALCLALSPTRSLTGRTVLIGSISVLAAAVLGWVVRGRPVPPALWPAITAIHSSLRDRLVAVLAIVVALAFGYSLALAVFTPINDGDALAYHVARAAFWQQEGGVGYVDSAVDSRLNGNPPNAEIGMLFTMLLAGSDRFVALPQMVAYVALIACVVGLALRVGFDPREALFGGLLVGSLPIVLLQASTGLNDLVVAAFLGLATYFALRPGRAALALFALALALAVGTKIIVPVAVPLLLVVVLVGRPRADWPKAGLAALVGVALGSVWYVVNALESGDPSGGLTEGSGQRAGTSPAAMAVTLLRLLLDVVDLSGTPGPFLVAYLVVGGTMILVAAALRARGPGSLPLAVGGLLVAATLLVYPIFDVLQDVVFRSWAALGRPPTPDFEHGWDLNVVADPGLSWYGPLGILLFGGGIVAIALWRRKAVSDLTVVFALAPFVVLATLATLIVWDSVRGRLVIFGVALASSTWGLLLRKRALAIGAVGVASIATVSSMLNYQGKASGIGVLLNVPNRFDVSVRSVWGAPRAEVQTRTRPGTPEHDVIRFVDEAIPTEARVAIAPRENDFLSPYFGSRLSREVSLVLDGGTPPPAAEWLVISPFTDVVRCARSWRTELELESGWRVERRLAPDACLPDQTLAP